VTFVDKWTFIIGNASRLKVSQSILKRRAICRLIVGIYGDRIKASDPSIGPTGLFDLRI
jgi:hypothetical protein